MDAGCDIVGIFRHDKVRFTSLERVLIDTFNPSVELNYIKSQNYTKLRREAQIQPSLKRNTQA